MRALIVTADDVGLHRGMTEGAIRAHVEGIVTACSVVANGAAFEHAVERLRHVPRLEVGVHLALVEERPLASHVPSLVGANGLFHESYTAFAPRYAVGLIRIEEVEHELRMQIERVLGTGLRVVHLNGHQHLHLLPRIFDLVHQLAEEYDIGYVRTVTEPLRAPGVPPLRAASVAVLSRLGRRARGHCAGVTTNDRTIGVLQAGRIRDVEPLLDAVDGITELVCHPGVGDAELGTAYDWKYEWDAETAALCRPSLREALSRRVIQLIGPGGTESL